jgi:hypothetical protein
MFVFVCFLIEFNEIENAGVLRLLGKSVAICFAGNGL